MNVRCNALAVAAFAFDTQGLERLGRCVDLSNQLRDELLSYAGDVADETWTDLETLFTDAKKNLEAIIDDGTAVFEELGELGQKLIERVAEQREKFWKDLFNLELRVGEFFVLWSPEWQDARCRRSANSGEALAALELEKNDPKTSVTFIHLACSGAGVLEGVTGHYAGATTDYGPYADKFSKNADLACVEHDECARTDVVKGCPRVHQDPDEGCLMPQLRKTRALAGDREVDAMLFSIGGNDAGFGPIAEACFNPLHIDCPRDLAEIRDCRDPCLDELYDDLDDAVAAEFSWMSPARVFLSEYPDAVRDENGDLCDDALLTKEESRAIEGDFILDSLNDAVHSAAELHEWTLVDGIFDGFKTGGICSEESLFYMPDESLWIQGNHYGTAHPNRAGQALRAARIGDKLDPALYSGQRSARVPICPPVPLPDGPIVANEGEEFAPTDDSFDPNDDGFTKRWSLDVPPAQARVSLGGLTIQAIDDTRGYATLTVTDTYLVTGELESTHSSVPFEVRNVAPTLVPLTSGSVVRLGVDVRFDVRFTDPGRNDTHTARFDWGDGTSSPGTLNQSNGSGVATGKHTYLRAGIYVPMVQVQDDDGGTVAEALPYVVVFDPQGGPIRGAGKVSSPAGALGPGSTASGLVKFDFLAQFANGATGSVDLELPNGKRFKSTAIEWMTVIKEAAGKRAILRAKGEFGGGPMTCLLSVSDQRDPGPNGSNEDRIRIKLWDAARGRVFYDTDRGSDDWERPSRQIAAGDIRID